MATMKEKREEALELFLRENGDADLELDFFHSFLCPVALAEAMVREHIVEDYDALELLVLRLYDIGFHDATWRGTFGGDIYINNGSHGCVNMPLGNAETMFYLIDPGFPVIMYWEEDLTR